MRNLDYPHSNEGRMMQNRLATIERISRYLREELEPSDDLPQWTHAKVATAQDRLTSAMQYLVSRMQLKDEYGNIDMEKAYQQMAKLPMVNKYLPTTYDVYQTDTHYCIDKATEQKLQKQRQFTYTFASPLLVYAGVKLGGKVGVAVSLLGIACGLTHYAQHKAVVNAPIQ
tara:strand:- start:3026 stop:3538 length:513 start_codon:yes stop_codon:yes gene_type:complete